MSECSKFDSLFGQDHLDKVRDENIKILEPADLISEKARTGLILSGFYPENKIAKR